MKNLNRKLSVIALSGMAVFGGVAASGVQAFASEIKPLQQEQNLSGEDVDEINNALKDAMGAFRVVKVFKDKIAALNELKSENYSKASNGIIRGKDNKEYLSKVLEKFLWKNKFRYHAFVLSYKGNYYIIQVQRNK